MKAGYKFAALLIMLSGYMNSASLAQTAYTWSGATSTSYAVATNWMPEGVPGADDSAVIPGGVSNFPVFTGSRSIDNMVIENNATLEIQGNGTNGTGALTVVNDLQNDGEIILNATSSWVGSLIITDGKLINNGVITSVQTNVHTAANIINGNADNVGEITLERHLSINKNGGVMTNTGSIAVEEGASFGVITNSSLVFASGTITGNGTLALNNSTLVLDADFNVDINLSVTNASVDGPGKLILGEGFRHVLVTAAINASFENNGLIEVTRNSSFAGEALLNNSIGTISVQGNGSSGTTILEIQHDLINEGNLELSATSSWIGEIRSHGKIINTGTITSTQTNSHTTANIINADVDNSGDIILERNLTFNKNQGIFANSGSIDVGEDLILNFINNGTMEYSSGSMTGDGSLNMNQMTLALIQDYNAVIKMNLTASIIEGPGSFISGVESHLVLNQVTVNASFENRGFTEIIRNSTFAGETVHNMPNGRISVQGNGSFGTTLLSLQNDLLNEGELELSATSSWYGAISSEGKIINSGKILSAQTNVHTSSNILTADVDNSGEIVLERNMTINKSGGILLTSGLFSIGEGVTLSILNSATLMYESGIFSGSGTMIITNSALALSGDLLVEMNLNLTNSVVDGPGKFTLGAESQMIMNQSTINAPFENFGHTEVIRNSTIAGEIVTNRPGGRISVLGNGSFGQTTLSLQYSLNNYGEIEIGATSSWTGTLTIDEGKLINRGLIHSSQTNQHTSVNTIATEVDNRGRIHIERNLVINRAEAIHFNTGMIDAETGSLTVTQSGTDARFVNYGSLLIAEGQTVTISNGRFTNSATGIVRGIGTLNVSSTEFDNHGTFMPGSRPAFGMNLIVNGDAESNAAGITTSNVVIAGWTDTGAMSVLPYNRQGIADTYPSEADPGPDSRGSNYFWGGANAFSSTITQTINVTHIRTLIDLEQVNYDLSGYLGGLGSQGDNMKLTARFLNSESAELGTAEIGPVSNTDRENVTGLFFRETDGLLPGGTRTIELTLAASRVSGTEINAFADNLELVLSLADGDPEGRTTGVLTVIGDFPMSSESARVGIGLGGRISDETYDRLHVTGAATVAGVLMIDIINGLEPVAADEFNVFTYGSRTGEFSFIAGTDLGNDLFLVPEYSADHLTMTIPGDPISLVAPDLLSPGNQSIGVSTNPYLQWSMVPGTAAYHVQVSENDEFTEMTYENERVLAVNLTISQLDPFVTFYWRSRAVNSKETGAWSQVYSFTTGETVVNIPEEKNEIPDEYFLGNNYPNPFNPQTTIRFGIPEAGFVTLDVYDMLGRRVATLVNTSMPAGYHTVQFGSASLSSGVYLYRISAGQFHQIKKMMLLK